MRSYVAVTDLDWFRNLRSRPDLDEVNFWQPGRAQRFRALRVGEPLLFKLRAPEDAIVGGGFFAHSSLLPASLAWEAFGERNGALSFDEMQQRIDRHRDREEHEPRDQTIGCVLLQALFFFDRLDWIPVPEDFHPNVGRGKLYDLAAGPGRRLWQEVRDRLRSSAPIEVAVSQTSLFGEPVLLQRRLGPGTFRVLVTDTYRRRCAITGEQALPVLEATHIRPLSAGGLHRLDNGILLRSDLRRLFDHGYLTVTPELVVRISSELERELGGATSYAELDGRTVWVPRRIEQRPRAGFLEWHAETVFRG
jgi:putative restriction endonuclease